MSKQTINIGASPNDGTGTPLRTSFDYTNQNFTEIYTALGGGVALPGATTQVIFNDGGTNLAGDAGLVYNKTTDALTVAGLVTAGSATITGALTVDTTTLVVDATNHRVGIKNAAPNDTLTILADNYLSFQTAVTTFNSGRVGRIGAVSVGTGNGYLVFETYAGGSGGGERYRIASDGVATWSNVGGVAGTAMTLNSTGLVVGTSAPFCGFEVNKPSNTTFTNLPANGAFSDSTAMAAGVGGGIFFQGRFDATTNQTAFAIISGVKENATNANVAGALVFGVRDASAGTAIERMRINSAGNIVMKTAGTGIDFSITANSSGTMTSELLNDYEEGTWTGTLKGTPADPTIAVTATGRYTKIGRQVSVQIYFSNVVTTGASGRIEIAGLPFANNASVETVATCGFYDMATFTGSPFAKIDFSGTTAGMYSSISNSVYGSVTHNAGISRYMWMNLTYTV